MTKKINHSFCSSINENFNYISSKEGVLKRDKIRNFNIIEGAALFDSIKKYFTNIPSPYGIDTESFVRHALITSHSLPVEIKSNLIDFKYSGNQEGYILIKSLQPDPHIPKTPIYDSEILFKKSFYSEYWLSIFSSFLGDIFGYKQEGSGKLFHNIRPTVKNQRTLSSESSRILLDFHTETAFHPVMPDYVLLYCLRSDRNNEASTIISSVRNFSSLLDNETIDILRQKKFATGIDHSFGSKNGKKGNGPVLSVFYGDVNDNLMTFDPDLMIGLDENANKALHKLKCVVDQHKKEIFLQEGDLLIVDNRRAVHGRSKFTAYYDGYDRWLQRSYVTRDIRQAEIIFSKKERVITYDFFQKTNNI